MTSDSFEAADLEYPSTDENEDESTFDETFVTLLRRYLILLDKSQTPEAKEKKKEALTNLSNELKAVCGKDMDAKKILKKIANMKMTTKKKTDMNRTGNKKIVLNSWQKEFLNLMNSNENPTFTKVAGARSAGFEQSSTPQETSRGKRDSESL